MKLPFVRETWSMTLPVLALALVLLYYGFKPGRLPLFLMGVVVLALGLLVLNFFRDPERYPESALGPKSILCPADGKVVVMGTAVEGFYVKKPCVHIAIFMNPLNNHVQRAPFDGKVVQRVYHPGKFLGAYHDKVDLDNEQAHLVVDLAKPGKGKMVIKQIAGFLCRRVVTTPKVGEKIQRGKRVGRILLGSRVDLFLPKGFKSRVRVGDQVRAGVTLLGELP